MKSIFDIRNNLVDMAHSRRFLYALIAIFLWMIIAMCFDLTQISTDIRFLALAIVFAGALAGGDEK